MLPVNSIKIKTPSGFQSFDGIKRLKKYRSMIKIICSKKSISVTDDHLLKSDDEFKLARDLKVGEYLNYNTKKIKITKIINYQAEEYVYDILEVQNGNEYFTNGFVSHNCSFIGSSQTLLNPDTLAGLRKSKPINDNFIIAGGKLYKEYDETKLYLMSIDSSKSLGESGADNDYICINVLELSENRIEQAFTYRVNDIHYKELSGIAYSVGEYFGFPVLAIENNEGSGTYTANHLYETNEYPNMYFDPNKDGLEVGVRTTKKNRPVGLSSLKRLIERDIFKVNDDVTVDEFFGFVKQGKTYKAMSSITDDCIMSLTVAMYVLLDPNNDLEVTIDDYLDNDVNLLEESDNEDVDFFDGTGVTGNDEDDNWLLD